MKPLINEELKKQINRFHVAAIDPLLEAMEFNDVKHSDLLYKKLNDAFFALITDQIEAAVKEARIDELSHIQLQYGHQFAQTFISGKPQSLKERITTLKIELDKGSK